MLFNTSEQDSQIYTQSLTPLIHLDSILELTADDEDFLHQLIKTNIDALQEFALEYRKYMLNQPDLTQLKFWIHRIKVVVKLLKAETLASEMAHGEILLQKEYNRTEAEASVARVSELCRAINLELLKYCTV